jgi:hypothetical protein
MSEGEEADDRAEGEDAARRNRLLRFARRLMDRREIAEDTRELLLSLASTSDKAKTEAVRMVAREVRNYLEELRLKEDLRSLMTGYSLEVSLRLKPLPDASASVKKEGT